MRHDTKPVVPESGSSGDSNLRGRFWSSSPNEDNPDNAWNVNFDNGNVNNNDVTQTRSRRSRARRCG